MVAEHSPETQQIISSKSTVKLSGFVRFDAIKSITLQISNESSKAGMVKNAQYGFSFCRNGLYSVYTTQTTATQNKQPVAIITIQGPLEPQEVKPIRSIFLHHQ